MPASTAVHARTRSVGIDPATLTAAADAALRTGDYAAAVQALDKVVPARPDDVRLLLNLGGALKELGRFDEALPVLERAMSVDPRRHGAWSNMPSTRCGSSGDHGRRRELGS